MKGQAIQLVRRLYNLARVMVAETRDVLVGSDDRTDGDADSSGGEFANSAGGRWMGFFGPPSEDQRNARGCAPAREYFTLAGQLWHRSAYRTMLARPAR